MTEVTTVGVIIWTYLTDRNTEGGGVKMICVYDLNDKKFLDIPDS